MQQQSLTERNRATVTRFLNATHAGDLDVIDETVAEGIVTHGFPGGMDPDSRARYKQFFRNFGAAFSGMRYEPTAMIAEGDRVAARFRIRVTHTGEFAGAAATGREVAFTGMALYRLEDGLIAETWLHVDERGILEQIGALAASA